jgi:hypothetical protein
MHKKFNVNLIVLFTLTISALFGTQCFSQQSVKSSKPKKKLYFVTESTYTIESDSSYFCDQPDIATKTQHFLVQGDTIVPLKTVNGYYYVEYQRPSGVTRGWISVRTVFISSISYAQHTQPQKEVVHEPYLALNDLITIFNYPRHIAILINDFVKSINESWAFQGDDSSDMIFSIKKEDGSTIQNQMLDWHKIDRQLEYMIFDPQAYNLMINQIKSNGFKLIRTQVEANEIDRAYLKGNFYILTAKIKLTGQGKYGYKFIAVNKN